MKNRTDNLVLQLVHSDLGQPNKKIYSIHQKKQDDFKALKNEKENYSTLVFLSIFRGIVKKCKIFISSREIKFFLLL